MRCLQCGELHGVQDYDNPDVCIGCGNTRRTSLARVNALAQRTQYIDAIIGVAQAMSTMRDLRDDLSLPNGATPLMVARRLIEVEAALPRIRLKLEQAYKACGMSLPTEATILLLATSPTIER